MSNKFLLFGVTLWISITNASAKRMQFAPKSPHANVQLTSDLKKHNNNYYTFLNREFSSNKVNYYQLNSITVANVVTQIGPIIQDIKDVIFNSLEIISQSEAICTEQKVYCDFATLTSATGLKIMKRAFNTLLSFRRICTISDIKRFEWLVSKTENLNIATTTKDLILYRTDRAIFSGMVMVGIAIAAWVGSVVASSAITEALVKEETEKIRNNIVSNNLINSNNINITRKELKEISISLDYAHKKNYLIAAIGAQDVGITEIEKIFSSITNRDGSWESNSYSNVQFSRLVTKAMESYYQGYDEYTIEELFRIIANSLIVNTRTFFSDDNKKLCENAYITNSVLIPMVDMSTRMQYTQDGRYWKATNSHDKMTLTLFGIGSFITTPIKLGAEEIKIVSRSCRVIGDITVNIIPSTTLLIDIFEFKTSKDFTLNEECHNDTLTTNKRVIKVTNGDILEIPVSCAVWAENIFNCGFISVANMDSEQLHVEPMQMLHFRNDTLITDIITEMDKGIQYNSNDFNDDSDTHQISISTYIYGSTIVYICTTILVVMACYFCTKKKIN